MPMRRGLPDQADHAGRPLSARRRDRHRRATAGQRRPPASRPAHGRDQQGGRQRGRRRAVRGERQARWLHRAARPQHPHRTARRSTSCSDGTPAFKKEQFIPIGQVAVTPFAIMVNAESRWKTFQEFVDEAKQKPDEFQYASAGVYSTTHFMWEMILQRHRAPRPAHADHRRRPDHDGRARQARRHRPLCRAGRVRAPGRGEQDPPARHHLRQAPARLPGRPHAEGARLRRDALHLACPDGPRRDAAGGRGASCARA